jgi:peptidylprolyl isomerase
MPSRSIVLVQLPAFLRYPIVLSTLACAICTTALEPKVQGQSAAKSQSKITPEERAAMKQAEEKEKMDQALLRRQSFGSIPPNDDSPLAKAYSAAFVAFRQSVADLDEARNRQQLSLDYSLESQNAILDAWCKAISKTNDTYAEWIQKAGELYASDPVKYKAAGKTLTEMLMSDVELDRFDGWLSPVKALMTSEADISDEVRKAIGMVGLANCDFNLVERCWSPLKESGKLTGNELGYLNDLPTIRERWARELEIRQKESQLGNNPLVELTTSKGRIVIELYEDSAPNAVASFIYLVENHFYDKKTFFRVVKHVCAQTGCEKGDGTGDAGYQFKGEADLPDRRHHFRGTVSVALGSDETGKVNQNASGSQIYFSFLPMPFLDDTYTVFGRVVEGMPSINLFRTMNLADEKERKEGNKRPEMILSAKVIRKRDHEYRPTILTGKLYR